MTASTAALPTAATEADACAIDDAAGRAAARAAFRAARLNRAAGPLDAAARDAMVAEKMEMARATACGFWSAGKYPIELEELEAEAYAALVQASRDYDPAQTILPWGPYASQRILWRLEDFIQAWYRLSRVDYCQGQPGRRRHVPLADDMDAAPEADPAAGLLLEDAERLIKQVLTPREQKLLKLRYKGGKNLKQAARLMGMTHLRARQLHCEAMQRLRSVMNGEARAADMAHRSQVA